MVLFDVVLLNWVNETDHFIETDRAVNIRNYLLVY